MVFSLAVSHPEKSPYCQIAGTPTKSSLSREVDSVNVAVLNVLLARENLQNSPAFVYVIMNLCRIAQIHDQKNPIACSKW